MRLAIVSLLALCLTLTACSGSERDDIGDDDLEQIEEGLEHGFVLADETASLARHNAHRAQHVGAPALEMRQCLKRVARAWAKHIAETNEFEHNPNLAHQISNECPWSWKLAGENIGHGSTEESLFDAWLASKLHHENLDRARYRRVGIGAYRNGDGLWMVVNFADPL